MSGSYTDDDLSNTSATENQADNSIASSSSAQSDRKRRNSEVATEAKIKVTKKSVILAHTKQITVNGEKMVSCTLEPNCTYMQKVFRSQNFARHFRIAHPSAYNLLCIGEPSLNKDDNPDPSVVIRTSKQKVVGGIVKIHTLHGLPFKAVEWEGFRDILEPQLKAFDLKINRHNVTEYIKTTADGIDWLIKQELAGLTVSLKLDIVSKMYRSFLGVNCQYVSNHGIIIKRTLGIIELHNRHTGQNLKEELIMVLKHFGLEIGQAISITIDNASNMVKMVQLMSKQAESMEEHSLSELVPDAEDIVPPGEDALELSSYPEIDIIGETYETLEEQTWAKALEEAVPDEFITTIRCGAHTTQLVVHDVCRETEFKEILKEIRKKCKKFRSAEYTAFFEAGEGAYPPLPNETRWGSDYRLMLSMKNGKKFFLNLGKQYAELDLSKEWSFIEEYVMGFEPLNHCTEAVQKLQLTLSDFYLEWIRAYGRIASLDETNRFKPYLISCMDRRQQKLFGNHIFRAAIFFDPRFNFNGSSILSNQQKEETIEFLMKTAKRIKPDVQPAKPEKPSSSNYEETMPKFSLNNYLTRTIGTGIPQKVQQTSLELKIRTVQYQNRVDADQKFDVIAYWAAKMYDEPQLWSLVKIIFGAPPTQCSMERDFSSFGAIFTKTRHAICSENLQNVLKVKTNGALIQPGLAHMFAKDRSLIPASSV